MTVANDWSWVLIDSRNFIFFYTFKWPYYVVWKQHLLHENPKVVPRLGNISLLVKSSMFEGFVKFFMPKTKGSCKKVIILKLN
jgi:hypothetical protein